METHFPPESYGTSLASIIRIVEQRQEMFS